MKERLNRGLSCAGLIDPALLQYLLGSGVVQRTGFNRRQHRSPIYFNELVALDAAQVRAAGLNQNRMVADASAGVAFANDGQVAGRFAQPMG